MMFLLLTLGLLSAVHCDQYLWDTLCGSSPYADAGREQGPVDYIIGGWEARAHEFPWQVSIRSVGGSHYCGGNLITPFHVLTAAHCTDGETAADTEVVVGEHLRDEENDFKQVIQVETILDHEDYRPTLIYNDISVLVLATAAEISDNVGTICAPSNDTDYANQLATVSGWGSINKNGGGQLPEELRYTNMWTINNTACRECDILGIAGGNICAGRCADKERDTCSGDSGGPLALEVDNKWTLLGVTSWGFACAGEYPGVYTRVSTYLDWVSDKISS